MTHNFNIRPGIIIVATLIIFCKATAYQKDCRPALDAEPPEKSLQPVEHTFPDGRTLKIIKCYPKGLMRAFCVSFDDGRLESDAYILESLRKRKMTATFFINTLHEQSREALLHPETYAGFEVASHGAHHKGFGKMTPDVAQEEIASDRKNIRKQFKQEVAGFAYPYGDVPEDPSGLEKIMTGLGIIYARGVKTTGLFLPPQNFLHWQPDVSLGAYMLKDWEKYLRQPAGETVRILMQFAHSIDYARGNIPKETWEQYLDRIAADTNIWNPTLLEFARYIQALKALEFSEKGIRNNSGTTVWVKVNNNPIKIKTGETIAWKKLKR
jgi:peptidoglycan/xylan/chitin deacetylase (PgdA/CDA1 family)